MCRMNDELLKVSKEVNEGLSIIDCQKYSDSNDMDHGMRIISFDVKTKKEDIFEHLILLEVPNIKIQILNYVSKLEHSWHGYCVKLIPTI